MDRLRQLLQRYCHPIVSAVQWAIAFRDRVMAARPSYSQHGEDRIIKGLLLDYDLSTGMYVDVGANQPTKISNTYLFYRDGLHGIVIDPNRNVLRLYETIRPRDIAVAVGCGETCEVLEFKHS